MAIRTLFKNPLPKNGQEELAKGNIRVRFRHYKSTARMLAVALEGGLDSVPNFLENHNYISKLTLVFCYNDANIALLLSSLERYGWVRQTDALRAVYEKYGLTVQNKETSMREYIELLWQLFRTPDF